VHAGICGRNGAGVTTDHGPVRGRGIGVTHGVKTPARPDGLVGGGDGLASVRKAVVGEGEVTQNRRRRLWRGWWGVLV